MLWKTCSFHRSYSNDLKSCISLILPDFKGAETSGVGISDSERAWGGLSHLPALHGKGSKAGGHPHPPQGPKVLPQPFPAAPAGFQESRAHPASPGSAFQDREQVKLLLNWTDLREERLWKSLQRMMRERRNKILFKIYNSSKMPPLLHNKPQVVPEH